MKTFELLAIGREQVGEEPDWWRPSSVDSKSMEAVVKLLQQSQHCAFVYARIEEREGDFASLSISLWPKIGENGIAIFEKADKFLPGRVEEGVLTASLMVSTGALEGLRRVRFGQAIIPNRIEAEDTFGMVIDPGKWPKDAAEYPLGKTALRRLVKLPLYDVTAEARELGQIALFSALYPIPEKEVAEAILQDPHAEDD